MSLSYWCNFGWIWYELLRLRPVKKNYRTGKVKPIWIQKLSKFIGIPEVPGVWVAGMGLFRPKLITKLFYPAPDRVARVDLLGWVPHPTSTQTISILPAEKYPQIFFMLIILWRIKDYDTKPLVILIIV